MRCGESNLKGDHSPLQNPERVATGGYHSTRFCIACYGFATAGSRFVQVLKSRVVATRRYPLRLYYISDLTRFGVLRRIFFHLLHTLVAAHRDFLTTHLHLDSPIVNSPITHGTLVCIHESFSLQFQVICKLLQRKSGTGSCPSRTFNSCKVASREWIRLPKSCSFASPGWKVGAC